MHELRKKVLEGVTENITYNVSIAFIIRVLKTDIKTITPTLVSLGACKKEDDLLDLMKDAEEPEKKLIIILLQKLSPIQDLVRDQVRIHLESSDLIEEFDILTRLNVEEAGDTTNYSDFFRTQVDAEAARIGAIISGMLWEQAEEIILVS